MLRLKYNLWFGVLEDELRVSKNLKESFKSAFNTSPLPFNVSELGFRVFGSDYYTLLRRVAIEVGEEKMRKELGSDENYLIALVKALNGVEEVINTLKEKKEDLRVVRESEVQKDFESGIEELEKLRKKIEEEIESMMGKIAPNLSEVAGSKIGAKLIEKFGSLKRLAFSPASKIQIAGAEKSLYKAIARIKRGKDAKMPKHGIIFLHSFVRNLPKQKRGKMARFLATKISIASKIDFFRGELEEGIYESVKRKYEELRRK
ncbi:MAG: RNA-processing protein [Archaeoglobaceae archaeon]